MKKVMEYCYEPEMEEVCKYVTDDIGNAILCICSCMFFMPIFALFIYGANYQLYFGQDRIFLVFRGGTYLA